MLGTPRIVLGLVWQLVRMALQRRASVKGMPELLALSEPDEVRKFRDSMLCSLQ